MTISIIIPIYNAELYLRQCIDSILSQSISDYEIILINDGSTDNSLSICKQYAEIHKNISILNEKNEGVSASRNKGLNVAKGEWIIFIDADDYLMPNALQTLYSCAHTTNSDIILANALKLKDGKESSPILQLNNENLSKKLYPIKHFALWGYLFKRSLISENKLEFINGLAYSEDRIFIYQYIRLCKTISYINSPIYIYRINVSSACSSRDGIKKAKHQFWAASVLNTMAKNELTFSYRLELLKESEKTINMGFYSFIETRMKFNKINELYKLYTFYFSRNLFRFSIYYLENKLLYTKRRCGYYMRKILS